MFKLPLFHDFDGVDCLVVGGGEIALRTDLLCRVNGHLGVVFVGCDRIRVRLVLGSSDLSLVY